MFATGMEMESGAGRASMGRASIGGVSKRDEEYIPMVLPNESFKRSINLKGIEERKSLTPMKESIARSAAEK